jgi:putative flippase GtrA
MFGLHPIVGGLTLIVDMMLFPLDIVSGGADLLISCTVGVMVAIIAFLAQKKWYGDDGESAFIKALILGLLTSIPTALPAVIYAPAGVVGLVHSLRKK